MRPFVGELQVKKESRFTKVNGSAQGVEALLGYFFLYT